MTNPNELLALNLQFFSEEPPADIIPPTDPIPPIEPEKTFTQAELDDIIAKRLARAKADIPQDYEEVKTKLADFEQAENERKQAQMSELEKLQTQLDGKLAREQELAQELEVVRNQAKQERIRNAFIQSATTNNVAYVDAALKLADLSAIEVGEDGAVIGVDDLVKALVTDNPFLVAKKPPTQIGEPSNPGKGDNEKTSAQLLEEAAEKARKSGRTEDKVAYAALKRELGK